MRSPVEHVLGFASETGRSPRVLLVVAHPDDETIGASGLLQAVVAAGVPVAVAHMTDGAPGMADALANGFITRAAYARARRLEVERALQCIAAPPPGRYGLNFRDQDVSFRLPAAVDAVERLVERWRPTVILTHPYEGGHPDHDATALAVHVAAFRLRRRRHAAPALLEMTSYHSFDGALRTGCFLPDYPAREFSLTLDAAAREVKRQMLACFKTQQRTLRPFVKATSSGRELFRAAPAYDFRRPPHQGVLFYEFFPWGVHGTDWRRLASGTLDAVAEGTACL